MAAIQCLGVFDGPADAVAEFRDAIGKDRNPALARAPVARGQIMQHLGEAVLLQLLAENRFFEVIGKQILHTREPGGLRCCEAFDERQLVEEHG